MGKSLNSKKWKVKKEDTGITGAGVLMSREADDISSSRANTVVKDMESKRIKGRVEVGEQLLPGMLNEITLEHVVTRLPWSDCHALSWVSRGWQQAIHSRQVYDTRVRTQSTRTHVLMMHNRSTVTDYDDDDDDTRLVLFSPSDGSCYYLPPIPGVYKGHLEYSECISLDGKVYVLGGLESKLSTNGDYLNEVITCGRGSAKAYAFDVAGERRWKQCASMVEPRAHFGCGAINGKIYVIGGASWWIEDSKVGPIYCGCEVYDPLSDTWTSIASTKSSGFFHQVVSMGEELLVHSQFYVQGTSEPFYNPLEVYDPLKNRWRTLEDSRPRGFVDLLLTVGGKVHNLGYHDFGIWYWGPLEKSSETSESESHHRRTFSFDASPGRTALVVAATVVDDELLGLIHNYSLVDSDVTSDGFQLMKSKGLGCQSKQIEWQSVRSNSSLASDHNCGFLCPIQL